MERNNPEPVINEWKQAREIGKIRRQAVLDVFRNEPEKFFDVVELEKRTRINRAGVSHVIQSMKKKGWKFETINANDPKTGNKLKYRLKDCSSRTGNTE